MDNGAVGNDEQEVHRRSMHVLPAGASWSAAGWAACVSLAGTAKLLLERLEKAHRQIRGDGNRRKCAGAAGLLPACPPGLRRRAATAVVPGGGSGAATPYFYFQPRRRDSRQSSGSSLPASWCQAHVQKVGEVSAGEQLPAVQAAGTRTLAFAALYVHLLAAAKKTVWAKSALA